MRQTATDSITEHYIADSVRHELDRLMYAVYRRFGTPTRKNGNCFAQIDQTIIVNPTSGALRVTLPKLAHSSIGQFVTVKNHSDSTNEITVYSSGGDTIDDLTSESITTARQAKVFMALSSTQWGVF